jgi:hypothetical protein
MAGRFLPDKQDRGQLAHLGTMFHDVNADIHPARETEFFRQRLWRHVRPNARQNSAIRVRRPQNRGVTRGNIYEFTKAGKTVSFSGLGGGRYRDRTCDPSRVKGVLYR